MSNRSTKKIQKGSFSTMARTNHYIIDEAKKTIYADILALTEKETKTLEKFNRLGYEIVNKENKEKNIQRLNDAYITEYLKEFDADAVKMYKGEKIKQTISKGKTRDKGFNAGRNWFARTYPKEDIKEIKDKIVSAGLNDTMNDTYKKYKEDKKTNEKMSEEQYIRYFYWTKVFDRNNKDTMIFSSPETTETDE